MLSFITKTSEIASAGALGKKIKDMVGVWLSFTSLRHNQGYRRQAGILGVREGAVLTLDETLM